MMSAIEHNWQGISTAPRDGTRFYIDCEFDGHNGPLISMGIIREDGRDLYIMVESHPRNLWVLENVVPVLERHSAYVTWVCPPNLVGGAIRSFIGLCECPVIIADSPVDIARFCAAISTSEDGDWQSTNYRAMRFEVHNVDCYPNDIEGAVQHNAWWDAVSLRYALTLPAPPTPRGGA